MKLMLRKINHIEDKRTPLDQIDQANNIKVTIPGFGDNVVRSKKKIKILIKKGDLSFYH